MPCLVRIPCREPSRCRSWPRGWAGPPAMAPPKRFGGQGAMLLCRDSSRHRPLVFRSHSLRPVADPSVFVGPRPLHAESPDADVRPDTSYPRWPGGQHPDAAIHCRPAGRAPLHMAGVQRTRQWRLGPPAAAAPSPRGAAVAGISDRCGGWPPAPPVVGPSAVQPVTASPEPWQWGTDFDPHPVRLGRKLRLSGQPPADLGRPGRLL